MNLTSKDISEDFPNSGKTYLNNASVSLMPLQSIEAMKDFLISYNSMGPDSIDSKSFVTEKLQNTRKVIAKITNCQPEEIILTQSTTDGINIVANGLSFEPNSNLIIRGLSHEHHANFYPWLRLQNKTKIKNLSIDKNGFFNFDEFKTLLDNNTKLVALSHALYNTGSILPIEKIGNMLENHTLFFIDSAQTVGCIGNFDVKKIKCDFMSFNGSKWLCGPMGTGLFYCNKKSQGLLEPMTIGGESAMIYDDTKLVAISHALYNTGSILPVEKIGNMLENNTLFFIDSAQTIGCIGNFDVTKTKCDFMSFNGSKWLCGPMGTGLFYCNKKSHELLEPVTIGGESAMIYDNTNLAFKDIPDKFQTGFRNYVGMVGLESSVNYLLKFGMENIREKDLYLSNLLREELSKIKNIILYGPETPEERTSIVSFNIDGYDPQIIVEKLEKQNIILAVREILEQKIIRASPHFFNTESEIFRVIDAIKNL